uniref:MYND-type domain-containing protein n=1 Tax=viral metagenome TaxID=1070528 RepID=A0A6C0CGX5_9ZZZZ
MKESHRELVERITIGTFRFFVENTHSPPENPISFIVVKDQVFANMLDGEKKDLKSFMLLGENRVSFSLLDDLGVFRADNASLYVVPFGATGMEKNVSEVCNYSFSIAARNREDWKKAHADLDLAMPGVVAKRKICAHCSKPARDKCSKCCAAYYCSEECQKKDWKIRHKVLCQHFVMQGKI